MGVEKDTNNRGASGAGAKTEPKASPTAAAKPEQYKPPIPVPTEAVVIQKVAGQPEGTHRVLGMVMHGGVYTTTVEVAAELTNGPVAEFTPFTNDHAKKIDKWRAEHQPAQEKTEN